MPVIKAISGHTGLAAARRYLERDGRALARDLLHFSRIDEAARQSGRGVDAFEWDVAMDETRRANGNDAPWRGRPARTYKHYVLSPDPRDGVSLEELRKLAVRWAEESFPDFQVAIVYHDDNEGRIPHAHVIVNNTSHATENRLRDPDPGLLNGRLQAIARDMEPSHSEGGIDAKQHGTRRLGS
ncbi:MAG: relaxase/mobilization nuclease domain-containing protein [Parafannyhessea sp.]|uniref:relaxase/mobilization nuclease domain-containing protein n=1 Tax=Parafannyhessea sp. TaxID=2847324 RepID=UPI003EFF8FC0